MADPTDPLELLRRLRPSRDPRPLEPGADPHMDELLEGVIRRLDAGNQRPDQRDGGRRRRRWLAAALAVGVAGGASAATAIWYETSRPDHRLVVSCWSDPVPSAQWEVRIQPTDSPLDACSEPWIDGDFGTNGPPSLVACVTTDGIIAVVPGDESTCEAAGLAVLQAERPPDSATPADEVLNRLLVAPLAERCANEGETLSLIDSVLDTHALTDWTVDYNAPFSSERSCGQVFVDSETHTIWIAPLPKPPAN